MFLGGARLELGTTQVLVSGPVNDADKDMKQLTVTGIRGMAVNPDV